MNIRFEHISARNFMSFRSLDLDISQFEKQTVLISGRNEDISSAEYSVMNGSGKTTMLNAILYAVYGETMKPIKGKMVANWNCSAKEDVEVSLTVTSDGTTYAIQRLLKGKARNGELHVFRRNGDAWEEATLSTMSETQRMIETDIVPCGKEGFLRCIILTADQEYNFFRMSKSDKNSFFEGLFELTTYTLMYESLHRRTLDVSSELAADSRLIDTLNDNIAKLKSEMESSAASGGDVADAEARLAECTKALEVFASKNKSVDSLSAECDAKHELFKKRLSESMRSEIAEFDSENGVLSAAKDGTVEIDESEYADRKKKALSEFDEQNGITGSVLEDGSVDLRRNDEYVSACDSISYASERLERGKVAISEAENALESTRSELSSERVREASVSEKIRHLDDVVDNGASISDILCDDCKRLYSDRMSLDKYRSEADSLREELSGIKARIDALSKDESAERAKISKYGDAMDSIRATVESLSSRKSAFERTAYELKAMRSEVSAKIESELERRKNSIRAKRAELRADCVGRYNEGVMSNRAKLDGEIRALSDEYARLESEVRIAKCRYDSAVKAAKSGFDKPIASLEEKLSEASERFDSSNETLSHCKALESVLKPDSIRKSVVPAMLRELNFRINGYLSKMGSNYSVEFDEDFDATFTSSGGIETSYNNFSDGESMRLSIACCLAFKDFMQVRLGIRSNLLMIDEYIDSSLDRMAVNEIMDFIHYMVGSEKIAALIISHRTEVKEGAFDSEILVVKRNNESKVFVNGVESAATAISTEKQK